LRMHRQKPSRRPNTGCACATCSGDA